MSVAPLVIPFEQCGRTDVALVGGKNASLGEMFNTLQDKGVAVPAGFATTAEAYWQFIDANNLRETIASKLDAYGREEVSLATAASEIRDAIAHGRWPATVVESITRAYRELSAQSGTKNIDVAVRSSATAEDLPDASFAGQQDTFLHISGIDQLLDACRLCYASLFTDRAITYRSVKGFDHMKVALSVGVQVMVRSDIGGSGVMFTIDTETGFDQAIVINAAWGLGENVVQGTVDPDEFIVFKPLLENPALTPIVEKRLGQKEQKMIYAEGDCPTRNITTTHEEKDTYVLADSEILKLARWAVIIEKHYGFPMDIEWAKDGRDGSLSIVQARPETVQSRKNASAFKSYTIESAGAELARGLSVGEAVVSAPVCSIADPADRDQFIDGSILVTGTTDPDWVPIMKRAAGVITDHGGRTSHAAIVSRELGLPAIVGAINATKVLSDGTEVTLSCAGGDEGIVYAGKAEFSLEEIHVDEIPGTNTRVMLNLANPGAAFHWWRIPSDGVGLARMEFVISNQIRIHPMALAHYDKVLDESVRREIDDITTGYSSREEYFVDKLAQGLGRIAASSYPNPVIVRMSDFKTNEYANLIGGSDFEQAEANPMLGFRGASRYYSPEYRDGFALECKAIKRLRQEMGFTNVIIMIPFCRTLDEADKVIELLAGNGLKRDQSGLKIYVMCEVPANVVLAEEFAKRFDGFSIGSNDLTQLTLGVDRDSEKLAGLFDEQDEAVKWMISHVIEQAGVANTKVGICGQGPSDHPEFAEFLVECGIDTISVTPDSFMAVKRHVANAESRLASDRSEIDTASAPEKKETAKDRVRVHG